MHPNTKTNRHSGLESAFQTGFHLSLIDFCLMHCVLTSSTHLPGYMHKHRIKKFTVDKKYFRSHRKLIILIKKNKNHMNFWGVSLLKFSPFLNHCTTLTKQMSEKVREVLWNILRIWITNIMFSFMHLLPKVQFSAGKKTRALTYCREDTSVVFAIQS